MSEVESEIGREIGGGKEPERLMYMEMGGRDAR